MINGELDVKGAPMSCAMIYLGTDVSRFVDLFSHYGAALDVTKHINANFGSNEPNT
jgi:hypothetical protein